VSEAKGSALAEQPLALVVGEGHRRYMTPVGLNLPPGLGFREWQECGRALGYARNTMQWVIGDWWNYGWDQYGHDRVQQADEWGLAVRTCQNYASVAGAFEISRRRENLSFGHHEAVAALTPQEADELLDWCVLGDSERRSIAALRAEVKRRTRVAQAKRIAELDNRLAAQDTSPLLPTSVTTITTREISPPHQPDPAPVALDASPTGGVVAPQLDALTLEEAPEALESPALDRAGIAAAVLAALAFEAALVVVAEWHANLKPEERSAARDVLYSPIGRPRS
jgi:hypothetical protein